MMYCCKHCGEQFTNLKIFQKHRAQHQNRIRLNCEYCNNIYSSLQTLNSHVHKKHRQQERIHRDHSGALFSTFVVEDIIYCEPVIPDAQEILSDEEEISPVGNATQDDVNTLDTPQSPEMIDSIPPSCLQTQPDITNMEKPYNYWHGPKRDIPICVVKPIMRVAK